MSYFTWFVGVRFIANPDNEPALTSTNIELLSGLIGSGG